MTLQSCDLEPLSEVAKVMRAAGVTQIRTSNGAELVLGPEPAPPTPPVPEEKPVPEPLCPCGHPREFHGEAGCLEGCSLDRCVESEQHPEPEEGK